MHALDVSEADFEEKVVAASFKLPVVIDFWAPWCAPCKVLKPILEKLAGEYGGKFRLAKVNSDENPNISARFGVRGIPSVKAVVKGKVVDEFTGALPEGQVREWLERIDSVEKLTESLAASPARIFIFGNISGMLGIFTGCDASSSLYAGISASSCVTGISHFAIRLKFCAVAANRNSSCAPLKPRSLSLSTFKIRLR